jgi:hypothetical protein
MSGFVLLSVGLCVTTGCENLKSPTEPQPLALVTSQSSAQVSRGHAARGRNAIPPACATPAKLFLSNNRAPGHLVAYVPGVDAVSRTAELATKYGFKVLSVWPSSSVAGFWAFMSEENVALLRCESDIRQVEENSWLTFAVKH